MNGHLFNRYICTSCGEILTVPVFCGDRFCQVCSVIRRSRVRQRLTWLIDNIPTVAGNRYFHLTLTIASKSDLPAMVKKLQLSFRRLRQRQFWKNHVDGGAFVIEITGRPGSWHAHIHAVVSSRWMNWTTLRDLWKKVSSGIGCYLTLIPKSKAVYYLTKYLSKPDMPDIVANQISEGLAGVRLFAPFGSWHATNKSYIKPKCGCRQCGGSHWMEYNISRGNFPEAIWIPFDSAGRPTDKIGNAAVFDSAA
jgi:hypothetical protein